jgi:signal transduction histidine kinase
VNQNSTVPQLAVLEGPDVGRTFLLSDETVVIGRLSTNLVVLSDQRISRKHFEIQTTPTRVRLVDLGSGNGTCVNGVPVQSADLRSGDRITIGDTTLEFQGDAPADPDHTRIVVSAQTEFPPAVRHRVASHEGSQFLSRPDLATSDWLRTRLANLAIMYEASRAISEILDVNELLRRIVDLLLRSTDADHACVLELDESTGRLLPKAVRSRSGGELVVSRTVAEHVLSERHGVLIADAKVDARFRDGVSIAEHQIREVICVPMKGRHSTIGVLFLDTQAPNGLEAPPKFSEDHLKLAAAIGHQAALAVEETRYYQALIQAERLAAVGQTIADLSHHIKNIMQGVRFGSDMVRAGLQADDRELLTGGWKLVEKNQSRIDELILDMLSFSKDREPLFELTDLASLTADVLDVVRGRAEESGVALVLNTEELPTVSCDPDGIHRALLNIISNAVDAVIDRDDPRVEINIRIVQQFVEIRISDNGPGIPADQLDEIFKPFVSSKGARGTGLGLPVSRKTVREHGGDVSAETGPAGALFVMTIPLRQQGQ